MVIMMIDGQVLVVVVLLVLATQVRVLVLVLVTQFLVNITRNSLFTWLLV